MEYEYEYVKIPEPFNYKIFRTNALKWLFGNPTRFIWNMGTYHALIILCTIVLGIEVPAKVMLKLGMGDVAAVNAEMHAIETMQSIVTNWLFLAVILFLDFALLLILKAEFKGLKLTFKKIFILEIGIFLIGIFNPYVRTGLLFFSANTLQISIAYRWFIKKWVLFQYFFILGSYILILKLIFYVVWVKI